MTTVAIDFGTSNTVVSMLDPVTQTPQTLKFPGLSRQFHSVTSPISVVPSLVFVQGPDRLVFGEGVRSQRLGLTNPTRYFEGFKRELAADVQPPPRQLDGYTYTPEVVAECFLRALWEQLPQQQIKADQVVFTVPVGAFERYLDWFRDVTANLGIPQMQLVDESTAAALGYAIQNPGAVLLVVDFGGGTLDLSLVRTAAGKAREFLQAEVIAKADAYVGGIDIDTWLVEDYLRQQQWDRTEVGTLGWQTLLGIAERIKVRLSREKVVTESWLNDETFTAYEWTVTRSQFNEILESHQLLEQVRQALDEILAIALTKGVSKAAIEQVLLVGGSCLIPAVQQLIVSYFGRQRVQLDKPFEAVAYGALFLEKFTQIEDYLQHRYAIRLWEPIARQYTYFSLFEKGMQYPCQRTEPLVLQVATDQQAEIRLDIGEVADLSQAEVTYDAQGRMTSSQLNLQTHFRSLESQHQTVCVARLDPPGEKGVDRIEVVFEVNAQRMLLATVRDLLTGKLLVKQGAIARLQ